MNRTEIHLCSSQTDQKGKYLFVKTLPKTQGTWERNAIAEVIPRQYVLKLITSCDQTNLNCRQTVKKL